MILDRIIEMGDCIIGKLSYMGVQYYTLELPWKDNARNISCIPVGRYALTPHGWDGYKKFKKCWKLNNVKDRSYILIHGGNFPKDTNGCILVGKGLTIKDGKAMVTSSRDAMNELRKRLGNNNAEILIRERI